MNLFRRKTQEEPARKSRRRVPQDAMQWREEAIKAEETEDWSRAVVCYRRALALSPFCLDDRRALENALEEQIISEGLSLKSVLESMAAAEAAAARQSDDDDEEFDDIPQELVEEVEEEVAPRRRGQRRVAMPARRAGIPRLAIAAMVVAALVVTGGALFAVAGAAQSIRGWFEGRAMPTVASVEPLPDELSNTLTDATNLINDGKADAAAEKLRKASANYPKFRDLIAPSLVQALRAQGNVELRSMRYEKAAAMFREAADVEPQGDLNWIDLGRALWNQARSSGLSSQPSKQRDILADAEKSFHRALAISPEDSAALYGLAQVYDAMNDRRGAVKTYEKLVAVAPSSFEGKMAVTALEQLSRR